MIKKSRNTYHHGDLAQSLLEAADEIATSFGIEAVTLRGCAKLVGVSPSSAFRHYADKRDLLTAFATRALNELLAVMSSAGEQARQDGRNAMRAVGLAYIEFAIDRPALFRAMWREEAIYTSDRNYALAAGRLSALLKGGFASTIDDEDPDSFSPQELLAWSAVHGLASLFVDGPVAASADKKQRMSLAEAMLEAAGPAFRPPSDQDAGR